MIESHHKIENLSGSPRQKVGGRKLCARTHKFFYAAKNKKISFKSYGFLQNVLRDFWILKKMQNGPFSRPIYHSFGYGKKVIFHDDWHGKTKKMYISDFSFLKIHHTLFLMIGGAFFKNSKCVKYWKNRKSLKLFYKNA